MSKTPAFAPLLSRGLPAATWLAALAALSACGGGGGDAGTDTASAAQVSGITVDRLSYGRLSTFTVAGSNLSSGVTYAATGCDTVTVLPGGSATQQLVTCTPNKSLNVRLAASNAAGELRALSQVVPKPQVTFSINLGATTGTVVVELEPAIVQATVDNFLQYVNAGFYTNTLFHRTLPDTMIQGGGFTAVSGSTLTAQTGLRAAIALESNKGLSNVRGSISMARTNVADSATSQFFINKANNAAMWDYQDTAKPGYAVFGTVVTGMAVVDEISNVTTRSVGPNENVPATNIVVLSATQTK